MSQRAVSIEHLSVSYGQTVALKDVTMTLEAGSACGLIGMNGSGKSTLFKAIMGVVKPDSGAVLIGGDTPAQASRASRVGYVPQSEDIDRAFPLRVVDVVTMGRYGRLGLMRREERVDRAAVSDALERVDLVAQRRRPIGDLSGGQRKRVFVARALAQEASVLLLDEPFAGVDHPSQKMIIEVLRGLIGEGRTVLVATHNLDVLPQLCDQAALLMNRLILQSTIDDVLSPETLARVFGMGIDMGKDVTTSHGDPE